MKRLNHRVPNVAMLALAVGLIYFIDCHVRTGDLHGDIPTGWGRIFSIPMGRGYSYSYVESFVAIASSFFILNCIGLQTISNRCYFTICAKSTCAGEGGTTLCPCTSL